MPRDLASSPVLTARNLSYRSGQATLLSIQHMELADRGPTLILGPNGAGKSLLLRLLHGIIPPSDGSIETVPGPQAMVFQRPVLLRRSVAANLSFALRAAGQPRTRIHGLLERAGLSDKGDQAARSLSAGEQQRLALVRALACRPRILFLDEPTSSLDPASTQSIETLILAAADTGTKVVMVSQDPAQARRLAWDVVFLHKGRLVEHTLAEGFFGAPKTAEAGDFLAGKLLV
ncbi:MAG: ATP-binding cassette domain-containing protein [Pseudomonadota bacterium]